MENANMDSISETILPVPTDLEDYKAGFAMDIGGSVNKLMYCTKERHPTKNGKSQCIRVVNLPRDDIELMNGFIRNKCRTSLDSHEPVTIRTTGVGVKQYGDKIQTSMNVRYENSVEFDCIYRGFKYCSTHLTDEELYFPPTKESFDLALPVMKSTIKWMAFSQSENVLDGGSFDDAIDPSNVTPELIDGLKKEFSDTETMVREYGLGSGKTYPCALVIVGSGAAVMKVESGEESSSYSTLDYTAQAGSHMMGLGRLLTGAKTYDELMALAEKGSDSNVHTLSGDLRGDSAEDMYTLFAEETMIFTFGKAMFKDKSDFAKEDLAAAVARASMNHLVSFVTGLCDRQNIKTVYFCGGMVSHPHARMVLMREFLERTISMEPRKDQRTIMKVVKLGAYLGAMGAWLIGMDAEKKSATDSSK